MANETMPIENVATLRYRAAVLCCALAGKLLAEHDLPALLEQIERAEAAGPVLDPTLWREKSKALSEDKEIVRAALPLRALAIRVQRSVGGEIVAASAKKETPK